MKTMTEDMEMSDEELLYYLNGTIKNAAERYAAFYDNNISAFTVRTQNEDMLFSSAEFFLEGLKSFDNLPVSEDGKVYYTIENMSGKEVIAVSSFVGIYDWLFRFDFFLIFRVRYQMKFILPKE